MRRRPGHPSANAAGTSPSPSSHLLYLSLLYTSVFFSSSVPSSNSINRPFCQCVNPADSDAMQRARYANDGEIQASL